MESNSLDTTDKKKSKLHWFHVTPGRLLVVLLVVEGIMLLSERLQWFAFNEKKGLTVLIATVIVGVTITIMLLWFTIALLFRRRFQFSIRSILLFTVVVAIPSSWLAVEMKSASEQKKKILAIEKLGGTVHGKYWPFLPEDIFIKKRPLLYENLFERDFFTVILNVSFSGRKIADTDLENLRDFSDLRDLCLDASNINGSGLEYLNNLVHIEKLVLSNTKMSDAEMNHIEPMVRLRHLNISKTQVTDRGLTCLEKLNRLQELWLTGTQVTGSGLEKFDCLEELGLERSQITDDGLQHISNLNHLKVLVLDHTQITDSGLEHLKMLNQLKYLLLLDTKVTKTGVEKLKKALPNCHISH